MAAAAAGLGLFVLAGDIWLAAAGAVLWGAGAALAFPMGMSAAADDPKHAAARVSVVSTMGYVSFLAGPPLLGYLGDLTGIRLALLAIMVPILGGAAARRRREALARQLSRARTAAAALGIPALPERVPSRSGSRVVECEHV